MGLGINLADWLSLLLSFGAVLVLLLFTLYFIKKINDRSLVRFGRGGLEVIQSISLGGRHRVVWVKVGGKELILGVTQQHITLLTERTSDTIDSVGGDGEDADPKTQGTGDQSIFGKFLRSAVKKE